MWYMYISTVPLFDRSDRAYFGIQEKCGRTRYEHYSFRECMSIEHKSIWSFWTVIKCHAIYAIKMIQWRITDILYCISLFLCNIHIWYIQYIYIYICIMYIYIYVNIYAYVFLYTWYSMGIWYHDLKYFYVYSPVNTL